MSNNNTTLTVKTWAVKDAFNQGKDVGSMLGQAVFEVITAVLGTKGLDKLVKGGKLALLLEKLKLDKAVRAVEKLVEAKNNLLIFRKGMESGECTYTAGKPEESNSARNH